MHNPKHAGEWIHPIVALVIRVVRDRSAYTSTDFSVSLGNSVAYVLVRSSLPARNPVENLQISPLLSSSSVPPQYLSHPSSVIQPQSSSSTHLHIPILIPINQIATSIPIHRITPRTLI
jgi:hypothetical protein